MKKKRIRHFRNVVLLVLYAFSILPTLVFHHHERLIVDFSTADSCEKAIYYGIQDDHQQHLSTTDEQCWLCDHHTITAQVPISLIAVLLRQDFAIQEFSEYKGFASFEPIGFFNKGPPAFLILLS